MIWVCLGLSDLGPPCTLLEYFLTGLIVIGCILLVGLSVGLSRIITSYPSRPVELEPQHLIKRKSDNYPLTVNDSQLKKALATGEYVLVEKFWGGGYLYSNGPGETYVPKGYQIKDGAGKTDPRLGK
jgi:hypothetical protein